MDWLGMGKVGEASPIEECKRYLGAQKAQEQGG